MSWGATAFTPIVTYNEPPFGFHEIINPADYKRCNANPYVGTELLKAELNRKFDDIEQRYACDTDGDQLPYSTPCNEWPLRECFDTLRGSKWWMYMLIIMAVLWMYKDRISK